MIKLIKFYFLLQLILLSFHSFAYQDLNILKAEVTGRSVIVDNNIEKARRLALEDALYLSSLKGGAFVEGFSSVSRKRQFSLYVSPILMPKSSAGCLDITASVDIRGKTSRPRSERKAFNSELWALLVTCKKSSGARRWSKKLTNVNLKLDTIVETPMLADTASNKAISARLKPGNCCRVSAQNQFHMGVLACF